MDLGWEGNSSPSTKVHQRYGKMQTTLNDKLNTIHNRIQKITHVMSLVGLFGLVIIAASTVIDVLSRWLFSAPLAGVYDLSTLFVGITIAACFPSALFQRRQIMVQFFSDLMPQTVNKMFDLFADVVVLFFFILLSWQLYLYTGELWVSKETTFILEIEIAPWWACTTVLFLLSIPVQLWVIVEDVFSLVSREFHIGA